MMIDIRNEIVWNKEIIFKAYVGNLFILSVFCPVVFLLPVIILLRFTVIMIIIIT
jgi:hypothetical protein